VPKENVTVVVPGIQGSSLEDIYPLEPTETWSTSTVVASRVFGPSLKSLSLAPSGKHDADLEVVGRSRGLLPIAYAPLVSRLRDTSELPVYVFAYDWRKSITVAAEALVVFVQQVVSKLTESAANDWTGRVNFVCHSMGGLVLRAFLKRYPNPEHFGRMVFIAVPHRGSLDAVEMMVRGATVLLGGRKEMRKLARTLPGVYELLPHGLPTEPLVDPAGAKLDVFKIENWQENVTNLTVKERSGYDVEKRHLDEAFDVLSKLPMPMDHHDAAEMLTIYGDVPDSTIKQIRRRTDGEFDFSTKGDGDGVVPCDSALLKGIQSVRLTMDQVRYFTETLARFQLHPFMPILDEVQSITDAFLKGRAALLPRNVPANHQWVPI